MSKLSRDFRIFIFAQNCFSSTVMWRLKKQTICLHRLTMITMTGCHMMRLWTITIYLWAVKPPIMEIICTILKGSTMNSNVTINDGSRWWTLDLFRRPYKSILHSCSCTRNITTSAFIFESRSLRAIPKIHNLCVTSFFYHLRDPYMSQNVLRFIYLILVSLVM